MRDTIRSRPGEVVLLSMGPFTNVAALFALDPEIPELLQGYVSMGGNFSVAPVTEWNGVVDPLATAIAYRWAPAGHISVGLDVTKNLPLSTGGGSNGLRIPTSARKPNGRDVSIGTSGNHAARPTGRGGDFRPGICNMPWARLQSDLARISHQPEPHGLRRQHRGEIT